MLLTGDRGHHLANQSIQIGIRWPFDTKFFGANIVNGLIVDHKSTIGVLERCMGRQDRIVRFDHGR